MNDVTAELESEYRQVEEQVREKYKEVFDQIEQELLERWTAVWAEHGFDATKVRVSVSPRIRVSLVESEGNMTDERT